MDDFTQPLSDISGRNIAFTCTRLWNLTKEELLVTLGSPKYEPLTRIDGAPLENGLPSQLVKAADWTEWIDEDEEDIRLFDFGESFFHGHEPDKLAQPGPLRVPETIFTDSFDYRVDLWRAGSVVRQHTFLWGRTKYAHGDINCRFIASCLRRGLFRTWAGMNSSLFK